MSRITHFHLHATILGLLLLYFARPITAQQPPPWIESNQNYNSPMATALIVMIIVFFTVGFISVYLRHFLACLGIRPYNIPIPIPIPGVGGEGAGWRREAARGLDPNIVNTFPTFVYSDVKVHRVGKTTPLECAICLNEFTDHEILRLLPKCSHVFHPHCIGRWLASHVTCPVCRANLEIQVHSQMPHELTSEYDPQPSDQVPRHDDHHSRDVVVGVGLASPETQEMMKGLSESGRLRLQRSHSTGHSLLENSDRFTLRLPEQVRNKLVNFNDFSGLPAAIVSPRVGYRAGSVNSSTSTGKPEERWRFSMSPPFISRPGSPKMEGCIGNGKSNVPTGILRSPIGLFKSIKSPNKTPLNHNVINGNDIGERSSDRLWADLGAHNSELENH